MLSPWINWDGLNRTVFGGAHADEEAVAAERIERGPRASDEGLVCARAEQGLQHAVRRERLQPCARRLGHVKAARARRHRDAERAAELSGRVAFAAEEAALVLPSASCALK